jgi:hypothetical protein
MKTAVEWLGSIAKHRPVYLSEVNEAIEMENKIAEEYAKFCISRREAELPYVDFCAWIDIKKNYEFTKTKKIMIQEDNNKIIEKAYKVYAKHFATVNFPYLTKEEFIHKIETDNEFAKKWGIEIEERALSLKERLNLVSTIIGEEKIRTHEDNLKRVEKLNIPTRIISLTFKQQEK